RGDGDAGGDLRTASAGPLALARSAAIAHAVYTPEVRHPVEVGVEQEAHLVQWLSKRLGSNLQPPVLSPLGYRLIGGRLLPGDGDGPVAQFMYEDGSGKRLTLYVARERAGRQETAFRYTQEKELGVFYWIDGQMGYALSARLPKAELGKIADAVYAQLEAHR
ncbi:anti-sigma factor family protein, partial [Janthinobacterium violaceinigrum]